LLERAWDVLSLRSRRAVIVSSSRSRWTQAAKQTLDVAREVSLALKAGLAIDLTSAAQVRAMAQGPSCVSMDQLREFLANLPPRPGTAKTLAPYKPPPNVSPEEGNGCWLYGSDSNYHYGPTCSYSPYGCIQNCINQEQSCCQTAWAGCQNIPPAGRDACVENAQDNCRVQRTSCDNNC
jgi:hypothetical protein